MEKILEVIHHAGLESVKLLPFLFLMYLFMEYLEHKAGKRVKNAIGKSGAFAPFIGSAVGAVPQCGFSASIAGLFSGGVIGTGTVVAVFLSTSDEMLPILLSNNIHIVTALKIIGFKVLCGAIVGYIVYLFWDRNKAKKDTDHHIHDMCEDEHCHCENGIFRSAIHHTLHILLFIFSVSLLLGGLIAFIGQDALSNLFVKLPFVGQVISAVVGFIPNCAASVVITELYVNGIITTGQMLSGLLSSSGIGLLVLFRMNKHHLTQNLIITAILFVASVIIGALVDLIGITF